MEGTSTRRRHFYNRLLVKCHQPRSIRVSLLDAALIAIDGDAVGHPLDTLQQRERASQHFVSVFSIAEHDADRNGKRCLKIE